MRKRNPNTIWRQELSELSSLGRTKLVRSACLFVVCNCPDILSCGLHWAQLAPGSEFYGERCYVCKGQGGRTMLPACAPHGVPGRSEGFYYQLLLPTKLQAAGSGRG